MTGERARFRGDAFLQTTVAREADDMLIENHVLGRVESRGGHLRGHGYADGIGDALAERAGGAFHAGRLGEFRMTGRLAVQLTEAFDFLHRQVVAAEVQPRIEEHAPVTGRQDKVVAADPARLIRVVLQGVAVKDGADFRATERQTEMPGLGCLHRVHRESASFGGRAREDFEIQSHACL